MQLKRFEFQQNFGGFQTNQKDQLEQKKTQTFDKIQTFVSS